MKRRGAEYFFVITLQGPSERGGPMVATWSGTVLWRPRVTRESVYKMLFAEAIKQVAEDGNAFNGDSPNLLHFSLERNRRPR